MKELQNHYFECMQMKGRYNGLFTKIVDLKEASKTDRAQMESLQAVLEFFSYEISRSIEKNFSPSQQSLSPMIVDEDLCVVCQQIFT